MTCIFLAMLTDVVPFERSKHCLLFFGYIIYHVLLMIIFRVLGSSGLKVRSTFLRICDNAEKDIEQNKNIVDVGKWCSSDKWLDFDDIVVVAGDLMRKKSDALGQVKSYIDRAYGEYYYERFTFSELLVYAVFYSAIGVFPIVLKFDPVSIKLCFLGNC